MMNSHLIPVINRQILLITGEDRHQFLQGLITNNIFLLQSQPALYTALLSHQGRFLHDFMITETDHSFQLEVEKDRLDDLKKKLMIYKLRAKVDFEMTTDQIFAYIGPLKDLDDHLKLHAYQDPRHDALGIRLILPQELCPEKLEFFDRYDQHRLMLGIPDGSRDLQPDKAIPLEYGFDALNAIAWDKGCYLGQELTARTRHLGVIRKGLFAAKFNGISPGFNHPVYIDDQKIGETLSWSGNHTLCRLRFEFFQKAELSENTAVRLQYDGGTLTATRPTWRTIGQERKLSGDV